MMLVMAVLTSVKAPNGVTSNEADRQTHLDGLPVTLAKVATSSVGVSCSSQTGMSCPAYLSASSIAAVTARHRRRCPCEIHSVTQHIRNRTTRCTCQTVLALPDNRTFSLMSRNWYTVIGAAPLPPPYHASVPTTPCDVRLFDSGNCFKTQHPSSRE